MLHGDLRDLLPGVLATAQGAALFAFLDPFGTALDRDQLVCQLLGRPGAAPTEVLLHMSISTVARIGGLLRKRRETSKRLSPADQKTIEHADRFLGGTWWQHEFAAQDTSDKQSASDAALRVAGRYQAGVRSAAHCNSVSMPIRHKPGQVPKYLLVLFTRHIDGMWWFADAVGKAGREWEAAWRSDENRKAREKIAKTTEPTLFDATHTLVVPDSFDVESYVDANHHEWERIIAENIQRVLSTDGPFALGERLDEVYAGVFGAAAARQVKAAVKLLHQQDVVHNTGSW